MEFDFQNIKAQYIPVSKLNLESLFDDNGLDLYKELENVFEFSFYSYNQRTVAMDFDSITKCVKFFIPERGAIRKSLSTHEMLHIYLRLNEINNNDVLDNCIKNHSLSDVFFLDKEDFMYICNFLDHILIYKDFKDMGYKDNEFVSDYEEDRFCEKVKFFFWYKFEKNKPDNKAISFYLSKYIGLRSPVCKIKDYSKAYKYMKSLNPVLFEVCKDFVDKYIAISNFDYDSIYNRYTGIIDTFVYNLKKVLQ